MNKQGRKARVLGAKSQARGKYEQRLEELTQTTNTLARELQVTEVHRQAFEDLVSGLPLAARRTQVDALNVLCRLFDLDLTLLGDRRGKHWAKRRIVPRYLVEIRGRDSFDCTLEEATSHVRLRTPHTLQMALSRGGGSASFNVNDEVYTVTRREVSAMTGVDVSPDVTTYGPTAAGPTLTRGAKVLPPGTIL